MRDRGDPRIDFPGRGKKAEIEERVGRELSLPCGLTGGIRRTFCDGLVELARCRSESRTCLMELEPFWKFDRREQPASRSSVPPRRPLAPRCRFLLPLTRPFARSRKRSGARALPPSLSHSASLDSSCSPNFDLIPCPSVLFLDSYAPGAAAARSVISKSL